jgi:hypothetical protein
MLVFSRCAHRTDRARTTLHEQDVREARRRTPSRGRRQAYKRVVLPNGLRFSGFVPREDREAKSSRRRHEVRSNRLVRPLP